jgi:hypothetical protein
VPEPAAQPALARTVPAGKAQFVEAADAVCAAYRGHIAPVNAALSKELSGRRNPRRLAVLLRRGASAADDAVRRLGALTPPQGDEATLRDYLETGREAASNLRAAAAALLAGNAAGAGRHMAAVRLASSRGRTIATRYGFLVCGTPDPQVG